MFIRGQELQNELSERSWRQPTVPAIQLQELKHADDAAPLEWHADGPPGSMHPIEVVEQEAEGWHAEGPEGPHDRAREQQEFVLAHVLGVPPAAVAVLHEAGSVGLDGWFGFDAMRNSKRERQNKELSNPNARLRGFLGRTSRDHVNTAPGIVSLRASRCRSFTRWRQKRTSVSEALHPFPVFVFPELGPFLFFGSSFYGSWPTCPKLVW